eukprot:CAMPEP_0172626468 /NCGR_PEP_ID=MMETSP1068-20121228/150431_1 /TAXON_ID=35684 /ORGANISM="Pseudopedinella elastica, Strain CCMP716" /LENGTH=389 /DNA_ID=CAMNT_0013436087 /DNA_START=119 /DNA_END=1285 /DNA_ORIENTATION=+
MANDEDEESQGSHTPSRPESAAMKKLRLKQAEFRKKLKVRLREADKQYTGGSERLKLLRRAILAATYLVTIGDVWISLLILVSALTGMDWIDLKICLCRYRCGGEWHDYYTANSWNVTFNGNCHDHDDTTEKTDDLFGSFDDVVGGLNEPTWNCQVQEDWNTCVCNEKGTSAVSSELLLNVDGCSFLHLVGVWMLLDAVVACLGLVQTRTMFKLAQYSPDADPVNLGAFLFALFPSFVERLCQAEHGESKALFRTFFMVFFMTWTTGALFWLLNVCSGEYLFNHGAYQLPSRFLAVQDLAGYWHNLTLLAQLLGLYFWTLGVDAQFKVRPRLAEVRIRQPRNLQGPAGGGKAKEGRFVKLWDAERDGREGVLEVGQKVHGGKKKKKKKK